MLIKPSFRFTHFFMLPNARKYEKTIFTQGFLLKQTELIMLRLVLT